MLLLAGVITVAYAAAQLVPMLAEDAKNRKNHAAYSELAAASLKTAAPNTEAHGGFLERPAAELPSASIAPDEAPMISMMDFQAFLDINPDCIGWLRIEDTVIDYPLVQGKDNDMYLMTGFDGKPAAAGTLFLDVWADRSFGGWNHPVYGHNMRDGSMFSVLGEFLKADFAMAHREMALLTPAGDWNLIPFAVYVAANAGDYHTQPVDEADVLVRAKGWLEKSAVDFEIAPVEGDRFLTLVTCNSNDEQNRRVVLHTILTR